MLTVVGKHGQLRVLVRRARAERVRRRDHNGAVHLREHALERLVEVDAVLVGIEGRVLVRSVERGARLALHVPVHEGRVIDLRIGCVVVDHGRGRHTSALAHHGGRDLARAARGRDGRTVDLGNGEVREGGGPEVAGGEVRRGARGGAAGAELRDAAAHEDGGAHCRGRGRRATGEDEDALRGPVIRIGLGVLEVEAVEAPRGDHARHRQRERAAVGRQVLASLDVVDAEAGDRGLGGGIAAAVLGVARLRPLEILQVVVRVGGPAQALEGAVGVRAGRQEPRPLVAGAVRGADSVPRRVGWVGWGGDPDARGVRAQRSR